MLGAVYLLCAATCMVCAVLLLRGYSQSHTRLLLWSGLCFIGLMVENFVGFIDVEVVPDIDLIVWRKLPGLVAILVLSFGLIWESK